MAITIETLRCIDGPSIWSAEPVTLLLIDLGSPEVAQPERVRILADRLSDLWPILVDPSSEVAPLQPIPFQGDLRLADVLGADLDDGFPAGELTWTALIELGAALYAGLRRRSSVCILIAAIAGTVALLSGWEWVFENGTFTASRWLLLLVAVALVLIALGLRAGWPRQSELLIDGAGLAILAIGVQSIVGFFVRSLSLFDAPSGPLLPGFWELVLLAAGCGLVAYGALERSPGPAWLGVANLAVFVVAAGTFSDAAYRSSAARDARSAR